MRALSRARLLVALLIVAVLATLGIARAQDSMEPQIVTLKPFQVVGITASTNNAKEAGPDAIIPSLWRQFMSQDLLNKIPGRVDQSIYAVYTDYVSDANGQYTIIIGAKVAPVPNPMFPEGMVVKTVPAGRFAVFTSERGPAAKVAVETWKRIWAYYQSPEHGRRAYQADFEVYDPHAGSPNDAQVTIYIGIK